MNKLAKKEKKRKEMPRHWIEERARHSTTELTGCWN
jgi:hypothetical protein